LDGIVEYFVFSLDSEGEFNIVVILVDLVFNNIGEVCGLGMEDDKEGAGQQE
jgi:hypothetical protein